MVIYSRFTGRSWQEIMILWVFEWWIHGSLNGGFHHSKTHGLVDKNLLRESSYLMVLNSISDWVAPKKSSSLQLKKQTHKIRSESLLNINIPIFGGNSAWNVVIITIKMRRLVWSNQCVILILISKIQTKWNYFMPRFHFFFFFLICINAYFFKNKTLLCHIWQHVLMLNRNCC